MKEKSFILYVGDSREVDEEAKEWEHKLLQNSMDKELHELNRRLEEKESEMKLFDGYDTAALKQYFGKKIAEVEDEKRSVQVGIICFALLPQVEVSTHYELLNCFVVSGREKPFVG